LFANSGAERGQLGTNGFGGHWPLLLHAAEQRNTTVARLSRLTLEVMSREDPWDAVLDGWIVVKPHVAGGPPPG